MRARPAQASIAAAPVSPEVAPTIVTDRPRLLQKMLEQVAQQLQGDVLEGERRPMEQLEQPVVGVELAQGRHRGVIEAGIRLLDQPAQLGLARARLRRTAPGRVAATS